MTYGGRISRLSVIRPKTLWLHWHSHACRDPRPANLLSLLGSESMVVNQSHPSRPAYTCFAGNSMAQTPGLLQPKARHSLRHLGSRGKMQGTSLARN